MMQILLNLENFKKNQMYKEQKLEKIWMKVKKLLKKNFNKLFQEKLKLRMSELR